MVGLSQGLSRAWLVSWVACVGRSFEPLQFVEHAVLGLDDWTRSHVRVDVARAWNIINQVPLSFADVPDINGNGSPSRSTADPSYQLPLVNQRKRHNPLGA